MKWPFVSRARFDDQTQELERLRTELAAAREELKTLNNWVLWRVGGGVALNPALLPEAYQPKAAPAAKPAEGATPINSRRAPGQVRQDLARFEKESEEEYQRANTGRRPISKEQVALVKELNKAAAEGQMQAAGD